MAEVDACPECGSRRVLGSCPNCQPGGNAITARQASTIDIATYCNAVVQLGLATLEELRPEASRAGGDVVSLARALVASKTLTLYQATVLLQGMGSRLTVGSYLVLERGGGRNVFKAKHRKTGREAAIKLLQTGAARAADDRLRERLAAAAKLKHPNIAVPLGMGEDKGQAYLVMEYAYGRDLLSVVREIGPLSPNMALDATIQAGLGLSAVHAAGQSHGGLDLSRLVLNANGVIRVVGLGQYSPTTPDPNADIRALGFILHALLNARSPADSAGRESKEGFTPLTRQREEISESLQAACQAMLGEPRRGDRPPATMDEAVARLTAFLPEGDAATNARASLKACAAQAIKRGLRANQQGLDRSVFAPAEGGPGIVENPDLRLEDLVSDLREEVEAIALTDDQLPPMLPRIASPKAPRAKPPARLLLALAGAFVAVVGLVIAAGAIRSRLGSISVAETPNVATSFPKPNPAPKREAVPKPAASSKSESMTKSEPTEPTNPKIEPSGAPKLLFVDEFDTPRPDWLATTPEEREEDRQSSRGYLNGLLSFRVDASNVWAMNVIELPVEFREDFRCEVDARVANDNPDAMRTQAAIRVMTATGGVQIGLDKEGRIQIWPTIRGNWNTPWFGPITHAAVNREPGAFNRIRVDVRRHFLTVRVNGERVCAPLELTNDLLPARIEIGLDPMMSRSLAEFERVEVAKLSASESEADDIEPVALFDQPGRMRLPDGTLVYEGGAFGGDVRNPDIAQLNAYRKQEMGKWTNDRYLQWTPNRGAFIDMGILLEAEGRYRVVGRFMKSRACAQIRLDVDTDPNQRGETIDLQQPESPSPVDVDLGAHTFRKGVTTLRFTCVNVPRSQRSRPGLVLLDELRLVPVE